MTTDKLGFDEVVDTLADIADVGDRVALIFADGFQLLPDLVALTPLFPKVQEVIMDAPLAWKQFKDLTVEETVIVTERLSERLDLRDEDLELKIKVLITLLSRVYSLMAYNLSEFNSIKNIIETDLKKVA